MTLSHKTMRRKKRRRKGKREEERRNELEMPRLFGVNGSCSYSGWSVMMREHRDNTRSKTWGARF